MSRPKSADCRAVYGAAVNALRLTGKLDLITCAIWRAEPVISALKAARLILPPAEAAAVARVLARTNRAFCAYVRRNPAILAVHEKTPNDASR